MAIASAHQTSRSYHRPQRWPGPPPCLRGMMVMALADHTADGPADSGPQLDSESAEWVRPLPGTSAAPQAALARLHELLLGIARAAALRRAVEEKLTQRKRQGVGAVVLNLMRLDG